MRLKIKTIRTATPLPARLQTESDAWLFIMKQLTDPEEMATSTPLDRTGLCDYVAIIESNSRISSTIADTMVVRLEEYFRPATEEELEQKHGLFWWGFDRVGSNERLLAAAFCYAMALYEER